MWIFSYFRNQLCSCDVVSRSKEKRQSLNSLNNAEPNFKIMKEK